MEAVRNKEQLSYAEKPIKENKKVELDLELQNKIESAGKTRMATEKQTLIWREERYGLDFSRIECRKA